MTLTLSSRHIGSDNNNMHQKPSSKSILIVVAVFIVLAIAYFYFQGDRPVETGLVQDPTSSAAAARVVSLLTQIQSLKIDAEFFNDAVYNTLKDHTQTIMPVEVGRRNPFAPISGASVSTASTTRR